jgi:hypothetical protein
MSRKSGGGGFPTSSSGSSGGNGGVGGKKLGSSGGGGTAGTSDFSAGQDETSRKAVHTKAEAGASGPSQSEVAGSASESNPSESGYEVVKVNGGWAVSRDGNISSNLHDNPNDAQTEANQGNKEIGVSTKKKKKKKEVKKAEATTQDEDNSQVINAEGCDQAGRVC